MSLNAIGVFGFLKRAHLDHMAAIDLALADRSADTDALLAIQGQTVGCGASRISATRPAHSRHRPRRGWRRSAPKIARGAILGIEGKAGSK
jgi:hypothetical protein